MTAPSCLWSNPLGDPDWDASLDRWPDATPFHASSWLRTLAECYGHRFHAAESPVDAGQPASRLLLGEVRSPLLGARLVALPFSDFAPPLGGGEYSEPWVAAACEQGARLGCRYVEFRGLPGLAASVPSFSRYWAHELDLTLGESRLWTALAPPVRTAVRRAEKSGISVRVLPSAEAVADYYRLHCLTRRRHGAPPQPWSFFSALARNLIIPGLGFVALGYAPGDSVPCAGAVFLTGRPQVVYKFGASDERGRLLRVNNLLMWRSIQHLVQTGAWSLHFGRTDLDQPGLRRFKLGWGARESTLSYFRAAAMTRVFCPEPARREGVAAMLCRLLPLPVARLAGRLLYPHLH